MPKVVVRREHLLELCRNAEEVVRIARDACLRAIQDGTADPDGFRPESLRVIQAHALLEGSLETTRQAAAYLRTPQSGLFRAVTKPPPELTEQDADELPKKSP